MKRVLTVVLICLSSHVLAQQSAAPVSSIRVTGDSIVTAKPDRVQIDIGVVTRAPQSLAAASQNASRLNAVLASLRKAVSPDTDIRTISYSLSPDYQYHPNGGEPTLLGYTATNVVRITLDELPKIGTVIDAATQAGANRVQDIQFTLHDSQAVRAQALREAAITARGEADTLAAALGLKVIRILSVEGNTQGVMPVRNAMLVVAEARAPTPIQPGTIDVNANVTLTVEVAPAAR